MSGKGKSRKGHAQVSGDKSPKVIEQTPIPKDLLGEAVSPAPEVVQNQELVGSGCAQALERESNTLVAPGPLRTPVVLAQERGIVNTEYKVGSGPESGKLVHIGKDIDLSHSFNNNDHLSNYGAMEARPANGASNGSHTLVEARMPEEDEREDKGSKSPGCLHKLLCFSCFGGLFRCRCTGCCNRPPKATKEEFTPIMRPPSKSNGSALLD